MGTENADDYLMLSGIQHDFFCKRQWALIHIEQYWKENELTVSGNILHKKVDQPFLKERRGNKFFSRAIPVISHKLKFVGKLDMVEFHKDKNGVEINGEKGCWKPIIIEYKNGKPKIYDYDRMQLVAEVIALEETLKVDIDKAYFFYNDIKRREEVIVTDDDRNKVLEASKEMMKHFNLGSTFEGESHKNCSKCSLIEYCMPRVTKKKKNIDNYLERFLL
ncbi:CRISPR-associated protein Cas4 [Peptostreptococcus faecalis]|uniref:CRISPR-associated protein Cas4 n=1 Tax=Peptostreptococcus faecalis TaxID=2045015 RepID=UPI000C7E0B8F|nr:CRISPR-associated protein Cas4 [Peptostreptococcus faecalis]